MNTQTQTKKALVIIPNYNILNEETHPIIKDLYEKILSINKSKTKSKTFETIIERNPLDIVKLQMMHVHNELHHQLMRYAYSVAIFEVNDEIIEYIEDQKKRDTVWTLAITDEQYFDTVLGVPDE